MNYNSLLVDLKRRSLRQGVWYRVLSGLERAQVDLTVRVVRRIKSLLLKRVLDAIISKLSDALQSRISKMIKLVGIPQAAKLSEIAKRWGHKSAETWIQDLRFATFLVVMSLDSR